MVGGNPRKRPPAKRPLSEQTRPRKDSHFCETTHRETTHAKRPTREKTRDHHKRSGTAMFHRTTRRTDLQSATVEHSSACCSVRRSVRYVCPSVRPMRLFLAYHFSLMLKFCSQNLSGCNTNRKMSVTQIIHTDVGVPCLCDATRSKMDSYSPFYVMMSLSSSD